MTELIDYRGPDDAGFVSGEGCSLGARRLSIIDVAGGHQPFANESGRIWAAQNGEIYNHDDLRDGPRARGHVLRSRCDTEVLPHLYEEHGPGLAERLRGMFAVAVWDQDDRRGVLIRDRLGVKPLYYAIVGDVVVFGSELKCVIASGPRQRRARPRGDRRLPDARLRPGRDDAAQAGPQARARRAPRRRRRAASTVERWWHYPAPDPDPTPRSAEEWAEIVLDKLDESVQLRLMSDVPLGAMLSGGLDSSLIVALMARHMTRAGRDVRRRLRRRGLRAAGRPAAWPTRSAPTTTSSRSRSTRGPEDLSRLIWHLDEPLADLSSVGFLALCELAAEHVTVALSGQGADELFGGYRKHRVASLAERWGKRALRASAAAAARRSAAAPAAPAASRTRCRPTTRSTRLLASSSLVHPDLRGALFGGALAEHAGAAESVLRGRLAGTPRSAPLEAALYLDARLGLVDDMLTYFDRASMACSLEVRVPFLDHEFVELAATIPTEHKVQRPDRASTSCALAAQGHVPDFVLKKRKRGFFNEAVGTWVGADGGALVDRLLLGRRSGLRRGHRPRGGPARRRASGGPGAPQRNLLLALVMLELWLSEYLPRALSAGPGGRGGLMLRYAVVTPARNEEGNLPRLAAALAAQTHPPAEWIVVDDGSTDATPEILAALAAEHPWVRRARPRRTRSADRAHRRPPRGARPRRVPPRRRRARGAGRRGDQGRRRRRLRARLLRAADRPASRPTPSSRIASGTCYEQEDGEWVRRTKADTTVWGATRAYRWDCLPTS